MTATAARKLTPTRTAHPYRDIDVIDARAPRFNQATVGIGVAVALVTGLWPILAVLAAQLAIGLRFGRRYCLPCLAYFELVQPRLGEGPIEDARPPRFANQVGLTVLAAASGAYLVGWTLVGTTLAVLVTTLALLAAATGFCAGCWMYRIGARLRGLRAGAFERIDIADLGATPAAGTETAVVFSHPLCTDCRTLISRLRADRRQVVIVDVRGQPDVARRHGVAVVPTAVIVDPTGLVTARLAG